MKKDEIFVTTINCMDGRVQEPVIAYMKNRYAADYVDMITEAGPNKILAEGTDDFLVASIRRRYDVSVDKHASKVVAIVGHYDCGGNTAPKPQQLEEIKRSCGLVSTWQNHVEVIGLWVDENWTVNEIK
jgi:carbonic anhydrase